MKYIINEILLLHRLFVFFFKPLHLSMHITRSLSSQIRIIGYLDSVFFLL